MIRLVPEKSEKKSRIRLVPEQDFMPVIPPLPAAAQFNVTDPQSLQAPKSEQKLRLVPEERIPLGQDIKQTIKETPLNLKIGTIGIAAGILGALKKRGMQLTGAGIMPEESVKRQFEPIKELEGPPTTKKTGYPGLDLLNKQAMPLPGALTAEAFGLVTRLPHAGAKILEEKQQKLSKELEPATLKTKPFTRLTRPIAQNIPQRIAAIGLGILTGDPVTALAFLGEVEGGNQFITNLERGDPLSKAAILSELSEAAEIGGEMLVLPKALKGFDEGLTLRQILNLTLENSGQEGVTGFAQQFLDTFGEETTKGTDIKTAVKKATGKGLLAVPENAWVGGFMGFGETTVAKIASSINKPITQKEPYKAPEHPLGTEYINEIVERIQKEGRTKEQFRAEQDETDRQIAELDAEYEQMFGPIYETKPQEAVEAKTPTQPTTEEEIVQPAKAKTEEINAESIIKKVDNKTLNENQATSFIKSRLKEAEIGQVSGLDIFAVGAIADAENLNDLTRRIAKAASNQMSRIKKGQELLTPEKLAAVTGIDIKQVKNYFETKPQEAVEAKTPLVTTKEKEIVQPAERKQQETIEAKQPSRTEQESEISDLSDEQLSGINKKRRRDLIKETAADIESNPVYQNELSAIEQAGDEIGSGFYYVHESGRGEVEQIIGKRKGFPTKLQKMFTFDRSDLKEGRAIAWDTAVQESLGRGREGVEETSGHMDLSEFVQRVKESVESAEKFGRLNKAALERASESGQTGIDMLAEKYRMLAEGFSDLEINNMIVEWANDNDIPTDQITEEFVNPEKFEKLIEMSDEQADSELERIATEQILAEEQIEGLKATKEILEANGLEDVEVETVEKIEPTEKQPWEMTKEPSQEKGFHSPENAISQGLIKNKKRPADDYSVKLPVKNIITPKGKGSNSTRNKLKKEGYVMAGESIWGEKGIIKNGFELLKEELANSPDIVAKNVSDRSEASYFYTDNGRSIRLAQHHSVYHFADSGIDIVMGDIGDISFEGSSMIKPKEIADAAIEANKKLKPIDYQVHIDQIINTARRRGQIEEETINLL